MTPARADVYVNLRPCGCRVTAVSLRAERGLETMKAKITGGWSLNLLSAEDADRRSIACDVCAPVRQEALL